MGSSRNNSPRLPYRAGEGLGGRVGAPPAPTHEYSKERFPPNCSVRERRALGGPTLTPGPSPALKGRRGEHDVQVAP